jgi:hypothetical protein
MTAEENTKRKIGLVWIYIHGHEHSVRDMRVMRFTEEIQENVVKKKSCIDSG